MIPCSSVSRVSVGTFWATGASVRTVGELHKQATEFCCKQHSTTTKPRTYLVLKSTGRAQATDPKLTPTPSPNPRREVRQNECHRFKFDLHGGPGRAADLCSFIVFQTPGGRWAGRQWAWRRQLAELQRIGHGGTLRRRASRFLRYER